jgi:hypothetical protein
VEADALESESTPVAETAEEGAEASPEQASTEEAAAEVEAPDDEKDTKI